MNSQSPSLITRREAIAALGAGAAVLGLGLTPARAEMQAQETPQPFTLPKLGYAYDALEPQIDARTMEIHYTKHHQAYINNANKVLAAHPELASLTAEKILGNLEAIPESIRTALRNNVGGHVNHSFFWRIIAPGGDKAPQGSLAQAIDGAFGSFGDFQKKFNEAAMTRFGSGWAWLVVKGNALAIHSSANQDSPLSEGASPVIGLDVWEHAYYLKHQNVRAAYVDAFWSVVNWTQAQANYAAATG